MQDPSADIPPTPPIVQEDAFAKLLLEIQTFRKDIAQQERQSLLAVEKLKLENRKLQLDIDRAIRQDRMIERKLSLDIRELDRSPWLRPGTIVPILATVGTIIFAQYQGVFDIAQRKLELVNLALKNERSDLERQNAYLDDKQNALNNAVRKLDDEKAIIVAKIASLTNEKAELQVRVKSAQSQVKQAGQQLAEVRKVAAEAEMQVERSYPAFRDSVLLQVATNAVERCQHMLPVASLYMDEKNLAQPLTVRPRIDPPIWLIRNIHDCFDSVVQHESLASSLHESDLSTLRRKLHREADQLELIRKEAHDVFFNPSMPFTNYRLRHVYMSYFSHSPEQPLLPFQMRQQGKALREAEELPKDEPRRANWIEWRRRFYVEQSYVIQARRFSARDILEGEEVNSVAEP